MLGVVCIFVYVGVEVIAIDTIGLYGEYQGFDLNTASKFGIYSLIALTAGYLLQIAIIPKYLSQRVFVDVERCTGICIYYRSDPYQWMDFNWIHCVIEFCQFTYVAFHLAFGD